MNKEGALAGPRRENLKFNIQTVANLKNEILITWTSNVEPARRSVYTHFFGKPTTTGSLRSSRSLAAIDEEFEDAKRV